MPAAVTSQKTEELVGEVSRIVWSSDDGNFVIARLASDVGIKGNPPSSGLTPGLTYRFLGKWENDPKWGRQFSFRAAIEHLPANRSGVVEYLKRYAPGIGPATAHSICDAFGVEKAIARLKNQPEVVAAAVKRLSIEKANQAAESLRAAEKFQETRIRLLELLANKGFGERSIDGCIEQWGVNAPDVVRRDPFKLMVARIFGAGYLRCDRLWHEFGLPPDRMKRQVMAAWEHMRADMSGSTWHPKTAVIDSVKRLISGTPRPERAVAIAIRAGVLVQCEREGQLWVAERQKGEDEAFVSEKLEELLSIDGDI